MRHGILIAACFALVAAVASAPAHARGERAPARATARQHHSSLALASRAAAAGTSPTGPASRLSVPDGAGGLYISWADVRDGGGDIFLLRVTNTGAVAAGWPANGVAVCNAPGDQFNAAILPDGSNGAIVAWLDYRNSWRNPQAFAQRVNSSGAVQWAANGVQVLDSLFQSDATLAPDGTGGLVAAWTATGANDVDVFAARFNSSGTLASGWNPTIPVCDATEQQANVVLTGDGTGGAILAWDDDRSGTTHVYAQRLNASGAPQWAANGIAIEASIAGSALPEICTDGGSGAMIFWSDFLNPDRIVGQRLNAAGVAQWTVGGLGVGGGLNSVGGLVVHPDGSGGAILAFQESIASVQSLRAQRVNGAGAEQWGASGVSLVSVAASDPALPEVVSDGAGGAYFVWEDLRNSVTPFDGEDLYAQRVSAAGAAVWTANGLVVSTATADQVFPVGAIDGAGGLLVAWQDSRNFDADIYAQRFNAAGTAQFAANGLGVYLDPGVQVGEAVIQTDDGGALVFFNEKSAGQYDVRVRKFNSDGSPAGAALAVCTATGQQGLTGVIDDGAGGAIVVWSDRRSGATEDLYAQRVNASGVSQWTANGVAICTASGAQRQGNLVSDGAGGAIFAWQDDRNFGTTANSDIYAQRINAAGAVQWAANGIAVCGLPSTQLGAAIASDGAGGAIIAWQDGRSSFAPAIYGQRLNAAGATQWAANGVSLASTTGFNLYRISSAVASASNSAIVTFTESVVDLNTFQFTTRLRAQKVDGAGTPQWGLEGTLVCDVASLCLNEQLVDDTAGGAYIAWSDGRNEVMDIYLQRINAAGTALFTANGLAVCNATGWQHLNGLTRDTGGDAYLTWADERAGQPDIYAQRVNGAGVAQWSANGVLVAGATRGQFFSTFAPYKTAAPARLYVAWTDNRAGNARYVYLQRLNTTGAAQWTANGVTRAQLALVTTSAESDRVQLTWSASEFVDARVSRREVGGAWTDLGEVRSDGLGMIEFMDRQVSAGAVYDYQLSTLENGIRVVLSETRVAVPTLLAFALEGATPNPVHDEMRVSFTLPDNAPAVLELLDVTGRRVLARDLTGFTAGRHQVRLDGAARQPAGVYFVRLTRAGQSFTTRAVSIR